MTSVYWAGRATLVRRPEDIELYDRGFAAWWDRVFQVGTTNVQEREVVLAFDNDGDDAPDDDDDGEPRDAPILAVRYSRAEVLRHRDFAHYSPDEFAEARRLMADLRLAGALRRSRRMRASRRSRGRPDLRRTVRRALRTGGEPISRAFVEPAERPRRIVLLCDVSGSMEPYARGLVRFLHAAVVGPGQGRGVRARHPPHPHHARAVQSAIPTPPSPPRPSGSPTGPAAPASARACAGSTTSGACAAWPAARSS